MRVSKWVRSCIRVGQLVPVGQDLRQLNRLKSNALRE